MIDQTTRDILHLSLISGLGGASFRALTEHFESAASALVASERDVMEIQGFGRKRARDFVRGRDEVDVDGELALAAERGVHVVAFGGDAYPIALTYLSTPPPVLYVKGDLLPTDARAFGIVGSRRSSLYGQDQAERFAAGMVGSGFTIVSGLARGIDIHAHTGALAAGGRTIAVLGNGLSSIYPPEHRKAADDIAASGAVISEFPMAIGPTPENFPRRNRIISGLSLGVLVVEAAKRSGALITARMAAEQGKDVFAVPGRIDTPFTLGTHGLIQDGAKLVHSLEDIVEEYPDIALPSEAASVGAEQGTLPLGPRLDPQEEAILGVLDGDPLTADQIAERSGLPIMAVTSQLTLLELKHRVRTLPGQRFTRRVT
jgi:DNA processing protein